MSKLSVNQVKYLNVLFACLINRMSKCPCISLRAEYSQLVNIIGKTLLGHLYVYTWMYNYWWLLTQLRLQIIKPSVHTLSPIAWRWAQLKSVKWASLIVLHNTADIHRNPRLGFCVRNQNFYIKFFIQMDLKASKTSLNLHSFNLNLKAFWFSPQCDRYILGYILLNVSWMRPREQKTEPTVQLLLLHFASACDRVLIAFSSYKSAGNVETKNNPSTAWLLCKHSDAVIVPVISHFHTHTHDWQSKVCNRNVPPHTHTSNSVLIFHIAVEKQTTVKLKVEMFFFVVVQFVRDYDWHPCIERTSCLTLSSLAAIIGVVCLTKDWKRNTEQNDTPAHVYLHMAANTPS